MSLEANPQDIAIVGLAVFCPGAANVGAFWRNLVDGVDSITEAPPEIIEPLYFGARDNARPDRIYANRGGFAPRVFVDPLRYGFLPVAVEGADPDQIVSLLLAEEALGNAGVFQKGISLDRAAVIMGRGNFSGIPQLRAAEVIRIAEELVAILRSAMPGLSETQLDKIKREYQKRFGRYQGDTATAMMTNLIAAGVANHFDMHGPAYTVDAACASGVLALQHGIRLLRSGESDIALVGAMHTPQSSVFWSAFNMMGALSHRGVIAPFSQDADGLLIGQGGGYMVIKTLDKALADDDRIYAVVKGTAVGSDGGGHSPLITDTRGQTRVLQAAWAEAGMDPADVAYVETHGTGTLVGDSTEVATLTTVFGGAGARPAYLGSVKSNIGHLMPAAGMAGLIKTTLALFHRQIPPTLHCETPLKALDQSRFTPVQAAIDWEDAGLPLVAGVNAFGFGGTNGHAVLTAFQEPTSEARRYRVERRRHDGPMTMAFSAPTPAALLSKFDETRFVSQLGGFLGGPGDPCRLVVFNPTDERLRLAAEIVKRGQPWLGRSDIWYTDRPLISEGGRVVFMFHGWDTLDDVERDSLIDEFGLEWPDQRPDPGSVVQTAINNHFALGQLVHAALLKTGVTPDLYTGHSIGEWHAARANGQLDETYDEAMIEFATALGQSVDPAMMPDLRSVAVSTNTGDERFRRVLAAVPEAAVANDNCPSQSLVCVPGAALERLRTALATEQITFQALAVVNGAHTPYAHFVADRMRADMADVVVRPGGKPLWSAITLDEITAVGESVAEVFGPQVVKPVRFRELIRKLYDEQRARVFIQVGAGPLCGFVDDILKGEDYATIQAASPVRRSIDQLRRVHALMWVMGGPADLTFMGMAELYQSYKSLYSLVNGFPIQTTIDALNEAVEQLMGEAGPAVATTAPAVGAAPAPATGGPLADVVPPASPVPPVRPPVVPVNAWGLPVRGFTRRGGNWPGAPGPLVVPVAPAAAPPPVSQTGPAAVVPGRPTAASSVVVPPAPGPSTPVPPAARAGTRFEAAVTWRLEDMPYVVDHSIVNQPADWPVQEDLFPVIPLTMSMELLAEIALAHAPGLKVIQLGPMLAMSFIPLNVPFQATVKGYWKTDHQMSLTLPGYLRMDITLSDTYPEPPLGFVEQAKADMGEDVAQPYTAVDLYKRYCFHHPRYWSMTKMRRYTEHGFEADLTKQAGKGSLLDHMGQAIGLFPHLYADTNRVTFPTRVQSVAFYQNLFDQAGDFVSYCVIREMSDTAVVADVIYTRDDKVWAIARGWTNQRVPMTQPIWEAVTHPDESILAHQIAPGVYLFDETYNGHTLQSLGLRYLTAIERAKQDVYIRKDDQVDFLNGRIALKDGLRDQLRRGDGPYEYPVAIQTQYDDATGKLRACRPNGDPLPGRPEISVAHKDACGVAAIADRPVGIDVERIEEKDPGFWDLAFTETEKALLAQQGNPAEWAIRFWVAKEAYGKMIATGLQGDPKRYGVTRVDGEDVYINETRITTRGQGGHHIVGWTEFRPPEGVTDER
ncbi:MAG: acyltransferase domain-containing protein [Propionibacteriaceae bacterium]|jgi:3-oxoacyl-(acyl-carrier-protein) synthase/malonyl CoA-acyl carrier protein transacylase/phosphopantetheinyl transferase|nr:acyltransferase domain-containing protein [Propionibacteriaceae bacterium]